MALAVLNVPSADAALVFFVFLMELFMKNIFLLILTCNVNVGPPQRTTQHKQGTSQVP
jgi:hypothetical protein